MIFFSSKANFYLNFDLEKYIFNQNTNFKLWYQWLNSCFICENSSFVYPFVKELNTYTYVYEQPHKQTNVHTRTIKYTPTITIDPIKLNVTQKCSIDFDSLWKLSVFTPGTQREKRPIDYLSGFIFVDR